MSLPYKPESAAVRPTIIKGMSNGQLPANVLEPCGIRSFVMVRQAARAMRALVKKAKRDGIPLSATGTYRSYAAQVALFKKRYDNTKRDTRYEFWQGKDWWLKPRVAGAAVPGTSNHGLGLAVDFSERRNGVEKPLSTKTLAWLTKNGPAFGFWNTVKSENWHWCWCLGDGPMPAAVLAEENYPNPPVPAIHRTIRRGDSGEEVRILQMKLNKLGATLLVDGEFGPLTEAAVRTFQTAKGLTPDGVVGPETWGALQ